MKKCGNRLICVYVCSKKISKKWQIHLVIIILIMMKTLQNIWKHKRGFQINIFMVIGIDKFQFVELTLISKDRLHRVGGLFSCSDIFDFELSFLG